MRRIGELFSARRTPAPYPFPPSWQLAAATVTGVIIAMAIIMGIAVAIIKIGGGSNLLLFFSLLFFVFRVGVVFCFFLFRDPPFLLFLSSSKSLAFFRPFIEPRALYTRIAAYRQLARSPQERQSRRFTGTARATRRFCECFHPICGH